MAFLRVSASSGLSNLKLPHDQQRKRKATKSVVASQASSNAYGAMLQKETKSKRNSVLFKLVSILFSIEPVWNLAKEKARQKIADRGTSIGVNLAEEVEALRSALPDWENELAKVQNTDVKYPLYYTQPFHAYKEGNLSWEAAFQVPTAAKLVHAPVMDPESKAMRADGDDEMRRSYSERVLQMIGQTDGRAIEQIVDLGCATGLSTLELQRIFPQASVLGIDLSPYFLAVGSVLQSQGHEEKISFQHGKAEDTGLQSSTKDLVSICLVLHELPQQATEETLKEAYRILRPGGYLSIMEMNPASPRFQRMFGNPFAFVPFRATEPWLEEYISLDLPRTLKQIGFGRIAQEPNTPGHFTLVAQK